MNWVPRFSVEQVGWLEIDLSEPEMKRLRGYIETAKKNPIGMNDTLVGNISKSLLLEDKDNWFFETVLDPLIWNYLECYPEYVKDINFLA